MVGIDFLWIFGGGLLAGLVGALLGLGGGLVAVPFLNLIMGVPIHQAAAVGLVSTLSVSCGAAGRYLRQGELVQVPVGLEMELGAALGGIDWRLPGGLAIGPDRPDYFRAGYGGQCCANCAFIAQASQSG